MPASPTRVAYRHLQARRYGDPGGTLSWEVHLGGDAGNWRTLAAEDGRSWSTAVGQIVRTLKGIRTRHGGTVDDVSVKGDVLKVYFEYDEAIEEGSAFFDTESALKTEIKLIGDNDRALEWVLHGSVDGHRSNLELKNEAIEEGFERMASSKQADAVDVLERAHSSASKAVSEAREKGEAAMAAAGEKVARESAALLERKYGIRSSKLRFHFGERYDSAYWYMSGEFSIPPDLDDDEADEAFEDIVGVSSLSDKKGVTLSRYTRKANRTWKADGVQVRWTSTLC